MKWFDYRERLSIGFSDQQKAQYFRIRMLNQLRNAAVFQQSDYNATNYLMYANAAGRSVRIYSGNFNFWNSVVEDINEGAQTSQEFLFGIIALMNSITDNKVKNVYLEALINNLKQAGIAHEVIRDDEGVFVIPCGAAELDYALVSQPLEWLSEFPIAKNAFIKALKQYSDATEQNASVVADLFRKALEGFFQEFFGGGKNLENYKSEYGKYLKDHGIPQEIANDFEKLLKTYLDFMNNYAKHHDKTSLNVLEYIMYKTGNIIRLVIALNV